MAMIWKVEFHEKARKELRKLDKRAQDRILRWLREHLSLKEDPRKTGKALKSTMKGLWRYRVGDYRIISQIQDSTMLILVVRIGHRKDIYD